MGRPRSLVHVETLAGDYGPGVWFFDRRGVLQQSAYNHSSGLYIPTSPEEWNILLKAMSVHVVNAAGNYVVGQGLGLVALNDRQWPLVLKHDYTGIEPIHWDGNVPARYGFGLWFPYITDTWAGFQVIFQAVYDEP